MKVWGFLIMIVFLMIGLMSAFTIYNNPEPTKLKFEQYGINLATKGDTPKWVHFTDCNLDLLNAVYFTSRFSSKSSVEELYVPIKTSSGVDSTADVAILCIRDKATLDAFNVLNTMEDESIIYKYMLENKSLFYQEKREIKGLARDFMDRDSDENDKLKTAFPNLISRYEIIDEGKEPSKSELLSFPLALILGYFLFFKKKKKDIVSN